MRTLGCIAAAWAVWASSAWAEGRVSNPDWLDKPSPQDISEAYPALPKMLEIEGRAIISCDVLTNGNVDHCEVMSEDPTGLGFGEAALSVTPNLRMIPKKVDGRPVNGGTVRIPISFVLPPDPPPVAGPEIFGSASPRAVELASRIVEAQSQSANTDVQFEMAMLPLSSAQWPGVDPKVRDDAIAAFRAGYEAEKDAIKADIARAYAVIFSEADLDAIAAFAVSPAGRALAAKQTSLIAVQMQISRKHGAAMRDAARAAFCKQHGCAKPASPAPAEAATDVPPPLAGEASPAKQGR